MVRKERSGKRNLHYSIRHREYGSSCIMFDIDTLEIDPKTKKAVAIIETKFGKISQIDLMDYQFEVFCTVAKQCGGLPVFCLVYYPMDTDGNLLDADTSHDQLVHMQYFCVPVNKAARNVLDVPMRLTELQWLAVLYKLRGEAPIANPVLSDTWIQVSVPAVIGKGYQD